LPVPGTGAYEWDGFRRDLPRSCNPPEGFIATANHNIQPKSYSPPLMFKNADVRFERITRLRQLLVPGRTVSLEDHERMQHDALSLRAAADLQLFKGWTAGHPEVERCACIAGSLGCRERTAWRLHCENMAGSDLYFSAGRSPWENRDLTPALEKGLRGAIDQLSKGQGADWKNWRWGRMHARAFQHPILRDFSLPPVERPGGAGTVAADGASYRGSSTSRTGIDRDHNTPAIASAGRARSSTAAALGRAAPVLFTKAAIEGRTTIA
jgi:acyl-homoserine lactone acylase PvdQ